MNRNQNILIKKERQNKKKDMQNLKLKQQNCITHNKQLLYIDLSLRDSEIYKCRDCIKKVACKFKSKIFLDQKEVESFNKKDIFLINQIIDQLNQAIFFQTAYNKNDKQNDEERQKKENELQAIRDVISQLNDLSQKVNLKYIKNIIFTTQFSNKIVQKHTFPLNLNVTTNMICMFNIFLIFGTQDGVLKVLNITTNQIIISKKLSEEGLVVVLKDPLRTDYFFVGGYDGNIIECQLKSKQVEKQCQQIYEQQKTQCKSPIEKIDIQINSEVLKSSSQLIRQSMQHEKPEKMQEEQKQNENINNNHTINPNSHNVSSTKNELEDLKNTDIYLKQRRRFCNKKQICRMSFCYEGKFIAAGVGKKIIIWNVTTGKVFKRLVGYHSYPVYGIENMFNGKYILTISKGTINMFDITKTENPLITTYKLNRNYLFTRVKKISENEFIIMIFPKQIAFFKIFQDKSFHTTEVSMSDNQTIEQIPKQMNQLIGEIEEDEDDELNCQEKLFSNLKSFKKQSGENQQQSSIKNIKIHTKVIYSIIKTGEIVFLPDMAYNINVFDNQTFNISGDYPFSILVNFNDFKNTSTVFELEKIISSSVHSKQLSFLSFQEERVLTSLLLENITIQNKLYKNIIVNMPRNSLYEGEEQQPQSLNLCFYE